LDKYSLYLSCSQRSSFTNTNTDTDTNPDPHTHTATPPDTDVYLLVAPSGNMVAQVGPTGVVLAGAQSLASEANMCST